MFFVRCAHLPSPAPTPQNPTTASSCLSSDNDLEVTQLPRTTRPPPTPALSSFLSQALQSVAEGSTARHSSKKEKKRKEDPLSDFQVQNGSHRSDVSERLWLTLFFHHNGKEHSSGTDAVWCDPAAADGNSTAPCSLSLSLHSCPAHPPGPRTPRGAIGAPHSPPPPLWAPPLWRAGGPSVCSSGQNLTGRGRSDRTGHPSGG